MMKNPSFIALYLTPLRLALICITLLLVGLAVYYGYAPKTYQSIEATQQHTIRFDNRERRYSVYSPPSVKPGAGIVFALHPSMSSGAEMRSWVGPVLEHFADQENLLVVYPDGYEGHFNDCRKVASYSARTENIDDVGFIKQIINELASNPINAERVYALGYSIGGHLAFRLALEAPDLVKGIVAIAANIPAPDNMACELGERTSRYIGFIEGTDDPINPYNGGPVTLFGFGNRGNVLSANASAEWFVDALGIASPAKQEADSVMGVHVNRSYWASKDAEVLLMTIEGGGHTIPQSSQRFRRILGLTLENDGVLESALQLFKHDRL